MDEEIVIEGGVRRTVRASCTRVGDRVGGVGVAACARCRLASEARNDGWFNEPIDEVGDEGHCKRRRCSDQLPRIFSGRDEKERLTCLTQREEVGNSGSYSGQ